MEKKKKKGSGKLPIILGAVLIVLAMVITGAGSYTNTAFEAHTLEYEEGMPAMLFLKAERVKLLSQLL